MTSDKKSEELLNLKVMTAPTEECKSLQKNFPMSGVVRIFIVKISINDLNF